MDLIAELNTKISSLKEGEYILGLKAVVRHIEAGFSHIARAKQTGDTSAYTDAVFRANQAFEGSIKEAYRVLANKNPAHKTIHEIETFLEENEIVKERVRSLFTNYRQDWRNPSTHDYRLQFDETEGFLACLSVASFAYILIDRILIETGIHESTNQNQSFRTKAVQEDEPSSSDPLKDQVFNALLRLPPELHLEKEVHELQVVGIIAGFLQSKLSSAEIKVEETIGSSQKRTFATPDILIGSRTELVVVEVKLNFSSTILRNAIDQVRTYQNIANAKDGFVIFTGKEIVPAFDLNSSFGGAPGTIHVFAPREYKAAKVFREN